MTLSQQKALVRHFLAHCNRYADDTLDDYRQRLGTARGAHARALEEKIAQWSAYRAFNEHAIDELGTGRLDDWFADFEPR